MLIVSQNLTNYDVSLPEDVIYRENKIYMFLEDSASIGIIDVTKYL